MRCRAAHCSCWRAGGAPVHLPSSQTVPSSQLGPGLLQHGCWLAPHSAHAPMSQTAPGPLQTSSPPTTQHGSVTKPHRVHVPSEAQGLLPPSRMRSGPAPEKALGHARVLSGVTGQHISSAAPQAWQVMSGNSCSGKSQTPSAHACRHHLHKSSQVLSSTSCIHPPLVPSQSTLHVHPLGQSCQLALWHNVLAATCWL